MILAFAFKVFVAIVFVWIMMSLASISLLIPLTILVMLLFPGWLAEMAVRAFCRIFSRAP